MRSTRSTVLVAVCAITLAGCSTDSSGSGNQSGRTPSDTAITRQHHRFRFGDTWNTGPYEFTPTLRTSIEYVPDPDGEGEEKRTYLEIAWRVANHSGQQLSAEALTTRVYGGGKQLQVKDYDSLAEPDIPSGTSRTWVYPYELPEEGTGIQVRVSLTNPGEANSGPVGALFTGTYRNN